MRKIFLSILISLFLACSVSATVTVETVKNSYTGTGTAGPFPYLFKIWANADLKVIKTYIATGAETVLTLNTDYTVTGAGVAAGGTVTLTSVLPAGYTITIMRDMDYLQVANFAAGQAVTAAALNNGSDKLEHQIQQLAEQTSRAFQIPRSSQWPNPPYLKPSPQKIIGWNNAGTGLKNYDTATISIPAIDYIGNYSDDLYVAISSIGTGPQVLLLNKAITLTANVTVPSNVELWIVKGGSIDSGGYSLTINGPIKAGPYQVFTAAAGEVIFGSGIASEYYPEWFGVTGVDDVVCLQAFFTALPGSAKVRMAGSYGMPGRVDVIGKNLAIDARGATFTLSGNSSGFRVYGTVTQFSVVGGRYIGDGVNRDALVDSIYASVPWEFGPYNGLSADVKNVIVDGVYCYNVNIGVKFYGTRGSVLVGPTSGNGRIETENCKVVNSTFDTMVGYVAGFGYGVQFSAAKGGISQNNSYYRTQRHGLYFAEGDNYTSVGDQFFEHKKNATDISSRCALMCARSQNVNIVAPRFFDCWYGNLFVEIDAVYGPTKNIHIISPQFYDPQKAEALRIGSSSPATEGVVYDVVVSDASVIQENVDENVQPVRINSGIGIELRNIYVKYTGYTGASGHRNIVLAGSGGAAYTDGVRISGKIIDTSTNGYGVQVAAALCTGTNKINIEVDQTVGLAAAEYVTAAPTNPNLSVKTKISSRVIGSAVAGCAVGTTTSKIKTANTITYIYPGPKVGGQSLAASKAATDDLWDLSGYSTGAGQYQKILLCLGPTGTAYTVAGPIGTLTTAYIPQVPHYQWVVAGIVQLHPSYAGGSLTANGADLWDVTGL